MPLNNAVYAFEEMDADQAEAYQSDVERYQDLIRERLDSGTRSTAATTQSRPEKDYLKNLEALSRIKAEVEKNVASMTDFPAHSQEVLSNGLNNSHSISGEKSDSQPSEPQEHQQTANKIYADEEQVGLLKHREKSIAKMKIEASLTHEAHLKSLSIKNEKIARQDSEIVALKRQLEEAQSENSALDKKLQETHEELANAEREKLLLNNFAKQVEEKLQHHAKEASNFKALAQNADEKMREKDYTIEGLKQTIARAQEDMLVEQNKRASLRNKTAKLLSFITQYQEEVARLKDEKENLEHDFAAQRSIAEEAKKLVAMTRKLNASRLEIHEKQVERVSAENENLRQRLSQVAS